MSGSQKFARRITFPVLLMATGPKYNHAREFPEHHFLRAMITGPLKYEPMTSSQKKKRTP